MILTRLTFRLVGLTVSLLLISVLSDSVTGVWSQVDPVVEALGGSPAVPTGWAAEVSSLMAKAAGWVESFVAAVDRFVG